MVGFRMSVAVVGLAAVATLSHAATWNKKTKVTFSAPFEIPAPNTSAGVMSLPAGTYVFKLVDSNSNRHIVQVTNERENKVYSTILAINDYRLSASSKTVMYFTERKAGSSMAIKSWFYPGDNFGQRFVYPKARAVQIAAETSQPVPAHTMETVPTTAPKATEMAAAPVKVITPEKKEETYSAAVLQKADATDTAGEDGEAVKVASAATTPAASAPMSRPLPKTASQMPFLGAMGVLILAAGMLTRLAATQLQK